MNWMNFLFIHSTGQKQYISLIIVYKKIRPRYNTVSRWQFEVHYGSLTALHTIQISCAIFFCMEFTTVSDNVVAYLSCLGTRFLTKDIAMKIQLLCIV